VATSQLIPSTLIRPLLGTAFMVFYAGANTRPP